MAAFSAPNHFLFLTIVKTLSLAILKKRYLSGSKTASGSSSYSMIKLNRWFFRSNHSSSYTNLSYTPSIRVAHACSRGFSCTWNSIHVTSDISGSSMILFKFSFALYIIINSAFFDLYIAYKLLCLSCAIFSLACNSAFAS